jgi:hypothetical protein
MIHTYDAIIGFTCMHAGKREDIYIYIYICPYVYTSRKGLLFSGD